MLPSVSEVQFRIDQKKEEDKPQNMFERNYQDFLKQKVLPLLNQMNTDPFELSISQMITMNRDSITFFDPAVEKYVIRLQAELLRNGFAKVPSQLVDQKTYYPKIKLFIHVKEKKDCTCPGCSPPSPKKNEKCVVL